VSRFDLHLHPRTAEAPARQRVAVQVRGELPEYGQIWVWDMLYAQQLFALGEGPLASGLRETLDLWAINMSSKVFQPQEHVRSKGHLQLSEDLEVEGVSALPDPAEASAGQGITLMVEGAAGELPKLRVIPEILPGEARVWLVLALAQYFIDHNDLFARELPIHLFAFRKYHADIHPPHRVEAAEEAPFYAIQKALEYFQSASGGAR
jgi:hypothetical protein